MINLIVVVIRVKERVRITTVGTWRTLWLKSAVPVMFITKMQLWQIACSFFQHYCFFLSIYHVFSLSGTSRHVAQEISWDIKACWIFHQPYNTLHWKQLYSYYIILPLILSYTYHINFMWKIWSVGTISH